MARESKGLVVMADTVVREREVFKFNLASACITKGRTKHGKNESNVKIKVELVTSSLLAQFISQAIDHRWDYSIAV